MNETAYNNWIHQQLEPTDILPRHKRDVKPYSNEQIYRAHQQRIDDIRQEEEHNAQQDAYLKLKKIF
jgi:hypothetical protein